MVKAISREIWCNSLRWHGIFQGMYIRVQHCTVFGITHCWITLRLRPTNKVRSWERSEPRSEPFVGQARFSERLRCYANSFLSARMFLVKPDRLMTVPVCSIQVMAVVILFWVANAIFSAEFRANKSLQWFWPSSTRFFIHGHMIRCALALQTVHTVVTAKKKFFWENTPLTNQSPGKSRSCQW